MPDSQSTAHTPGPWLNGAGVRQYFDSKGHLYRAAVGSRPDTRRDILGISNPDATDLANLQLASAAPDLLAALEQTTAMLRWHLLNHEYQSSFQPERKASKAAIEQSAAAIRKARGQ